MTTQSDLSPLESAIANLERHSAIVNDTFSGDNLTWNQGFWAGKMVAFTQAQSILADLYATEPLAEVLATLDTASIDDDRCPQCHSLGSVGHFGECAKCGALV